MRPARGWFERIINGAYERALPIAQTADYYRRFLREWGDGEIDRDKVEIARRMLRARS
jgi:hypothetical protein